MLHTLFEPGFAVNERTYSVTESVAVSDWRLMVVTYLKKVLWLYSVQIIRIYESLKLATQFGGENVDPSKYYNATTPVIITGATSGVRNRGYWFSIGVQQNNLSCF